MIANFAVILSYAGFALRNNGRCVVQLAHALLFSMVVVCVLVALLGSLNK